MTILIIKGRMNVINKKIMILIVMLLIIGNSTIVSASSVIDISQINKGIASINYDSTKTLAVVVEKDGMKEQYILNKNNKSIPLQLGNGKYKISALEHSEGNKFKVIDKINVDVKLTNANSVYLQSINMINFNENMEAIKKAEELTKGIETNEGKVEAIYQYVVNNIKYDNEKVATLTNHYLPDLNETYKTNKGICYDYASLTAGMLRHLGVPTKLTKGYAANIKEYHAWNEVFINNEWKIIDTTHDAAYVGTNKKMEMYKANEDYKVKGI